MNVTQNKVLPHRISALTDGIFAIVMTILVLDIKVPHDISVFRTVSIEQFLTGCFQDIIVYMIVFITLGYLWFVHHNQAHFIQHTDRAHLWISVLTLMFIALIPFSSSLVNKFPTDPVAEAFLASNMFVVGVFNYFNWAYAAKGYRLISETVTRRYIDKEKKKLLVFPLVSLFAALMSFIYPVISLYALLIAPVLMFFVK
ncbi:MAG: TMEM175 family protein [Candidatus Omnitrophica bacterium]|nr:TMEM175 family protein [Candidatus Omnitrophota bacterium]